MSAPYIDIDTGKEVELWQDETGRDDIQGRFAKAPRCADCGGPIEPEGDAADEQRCARTQGLNASGG